MGQVCEVTGYIVTTIIPNEDGIDKQWLHASLPVKSGRSPINFH